MPSDIPAVTVGGVTGLRRRATEGAAWISFAYGLRQFLRLINNLILARLLFPELFGVMTIVNTFVLGLHLFSDIGINPSIIQNRRGNEPGFLNTAWTLQAGRGILLSIGAVLLAAPVAQFYDEPLLAQVLPVSGLTALISGLNSTRIATANRRLEMGRLVFLELVAYSSGLVVMLSWAWLSPTIWALVVGSLVTAVVELFLSHTFLRGERNRLHWDWSVFWEIYNFGRWITLSTALTFLAGQSDKLILGRVLDTTFLGIYAIAFMFSRLVEDGIRQMGYRILFPSYAELVRNHPQGLYRMLRQSRLVLTALTWLGALVFIFFGREIIGTLYDARYADAGWMLQILAAGTLVGVLNLTYDNVLVAKGRTLDNAILLLLQIVLQVAAIFAGAALGGERGVVIGIASVGWLIYPIKALWMSRLKLWQPEVDLPVIGLATALLLALLLFQVL